MTATTELYSDKTLFSSPDMFSPPAERREHVIRFELTQGCDWNACTYCSGYKDVPFHEKSLEEYKQHVDSVLRRHSEIPSFGKPVLRRVFIGGGNALAVEGKHKLTNAIRYTRKKFEYFTDNPPKRISMYGRTDSILEKGRDGMQRLGDAGLNLIYWGVESGSNEVLAYVNKGCTQEDIIKAGKAMNPRLTRVRTSVMIMPGLGGMRFYDQHIQETAKVLGEIKPEFITFMGINPAPGSVYDRRMLQEEAAGTNRRLTDFELGEQMIEMIKILPNFETSIGSYDCDIDAVGHNPLLLNSTKTSRVFNPYIASFLEDRLREQFPEEWKTRINKLEQEIITEKSKLKGERLSKIVDASISLGGGAIGIGSMIFGSLYSNSPGLTLIGTATGILSLYGGGLLYLAAGDRYYNQERKIKYLEESLEKVKPNL